MSHTRDWLTQTLTDVLTGHKIPLNTGKASQNWLYQSVQNMHQSLMITEEVDCFFVTSNGKSDLSAEEQLKYKGVTSYHAISSEMGRQNKAYKELFESSYGFYQAGLRDHSDWPDNKPVVVPAKGDLRTLKQLHDALAYRLDHSNDTLHLQKAPLFIDNSEGNWTSYLDNNFDKSEIKVLRDAAVYVVESSEELKRDVSKHLVKGIVPSKRSMPKDPVVLFNTSNNKKVHEIQRVFDLLGVRATIIPFSLSGIRAKEAEEHSYTYSGNNAEKISAAREAIHEAISDGRMSEIEENLSRFKTTLEECYLLAEDRGLSILADVLTGIEFEDYQEFLNPSFDRQRPGVELAHILKGMSIEQFYASIKKAGQRLGYKSGEIEALDITSYQFTTLMGDETTPVYNAFGMTRDKLHFDPVRGDENAAVYSENYMVDVNNKCGRRNSEIPDYIEKHSAVAKAADSLVSVVGIKPSSDMSFNFANTVDAKEYRIATPSTALPNVQHNGLRGKGSKKLSSSFQMVGSENKFDFTKSAIRFTLQLTNDNGDKSPYPYESTLNKYTTLLADSHAFVFGKSNLGGRKLDKDEQKIHNMFQFFSLVVGKQVFDPNICKKPFVVDKTAWSDCIDIYMDLHKQSLIGDKPEHIYNVVESSAEAQEILDEARKNYTDLDPPQARMLIEGETVDGTYNVTIYSSATSTNKQKRDRAYDFSYGLAKAGMGVVNGGGSEGTMERVAQAVLDFRDNQKDGKENVATKTFLKCIQCEETFRAEGRFEGADLSMVFPNIFLRMEELQDVDAEVVLSGGAGTVQEILGSIINRLNNRSAVENKPLIIVNEPADESHVNDGVYDVVIKHLPQSIIERANIQIVENTDQAMQILEQSRIDRQMTVRGPIDRRSQLTA